MIATLPSWSLQHGAAGFESASLLRGSCSAMGLLWTEHAEMAMELGPVASVKVAWVGSPLADREVPEQMSCLWYRCLCGGMRSQSGSPCRAEKYLSGNKASCEVKKAVRWRRPWRHQILSPALEMSKLRLRVIKGPPPRCLRANWSLRLLLACLVLQLWSWLIYALFRLQSFLEQDRT